MASVVEHDTDMQEAENNVVYHYQSNSAQLPPEAFMEDLWKTMKDAEDKSFMLTIFNTNLLAGVEGDKISDTLEVRCIESIQVTEENEEEMGPYLENETTYWKTRKGALMIFEDTYWRTIPMLICNTTIPFRLVDKDSGASFNSSDYNADNITNKATHTWDALETKEETPDIPLVN